MNEDRYETFVPACLLSFRKEDTYFDEVIQLEVTDADESMVEVGFDYGKDRVYLRFRRSDLNRAALSKVKG